MEGKIEGKACGLQGTQGQGNGGMLSAGLNNVKSTHGVSSLQVFVYFTICKSRVLMLRVVSQKRVVVERKPKCFS